jgi:hypothetical protein
VLKRRRRQRKPETVSLDASPNIRLLSANLRKRDG